MLEVCCTDMQAVRAACAGGADRVELCSHIELDGLTPDVTFIKEALSTGIRVHVLIRPREGDFVYSVQEVDEMVASIGMCRQLGVHGVVIGALMEDGSLDVEACRRMLFAAEGMSVTFHRALDVCSHPFSAFDTICQLGFDRLLTSGQMPTALQGAETIRQLVERSHQRWSEGLDAKRLIVMPGSGVNPQNAAEILQKTLATEIHGTLRERVDGILQTTESQVKQTVQSISNIKS